MADESRRRGAALFPATGTAGCPCTDVSGVFASLVSRSCENSGGRNGVMLAADGPCVPRSYGSGCGRHDLLHDPRCALADSDGSRAPDFCLRSWCFVDVEVCKRSSSHRAYRSDYFPHDQGVDLFYSYTTCNSTADDWIHYQEQHALGGISISAVIPDYMAPLIYKRNSAGDVLKFTGSEYYDNSVPFEGAFINYLDSLMSLAEGDFTLNYTFGSQAARRQHASNYTAAVQDVQDGLVDMASSLFWVTGERLKMASFTVPLFYDKTLLVIPDPGSSVIKQTQNVLAPFTYGVWGLVIALIAVTALISVWFSRYGKKLGQAKRPERAKKSRYARLALDEFLQKGTFFCSAGVEQDVGASLPQKLLMFGFSFFILILVSSYVANLAAFLTRPSDFVRTMEDVKNKGYRVCAHPVMKTELEISWPGVKFVFPDTNTVMGMVHDYQAGRCEAIASGEFHVTHSVKFMKAFCESNLVFTPTLLAENPIAFPTRPEIAAGLSHWIYKGMKNHGIALEAAEREYDEKNGRSSICNLHLSADNLEAGDYAPIRPHHLFFPAMFFLGFAILAIVIQLCHQRTLSMGGASLVGRSSAFDKTARPVGSVFRERGNSPLRAHSDMRTDYEPQNMNDSAARIAHRVATSDVAQPGDRSGKSFNVTAVKNNTTAHVEEGLVSLPNREGRATCRLRRAFDEIRAYMDKIERHEEPLPLRVNSEANKDA